MSVPNSCVNLKKAIEKYCGDKLDPLRIGRAMANVVLGQMLPEGVVKGGSSLMFRYGGAATRYTRDVDTARIEDIESYIEKLRANLEKGWCGFTGKAVKVDPPAPPSIPPAYLMIPYDVKLNYNHKPWQTVRIEIGHNEIGDANDGEYELTEDMAAAFTALGFPCPNKICVMKVSHQIAQKLHAVSEPGNIRAHDLIDLQLVCTKTPVDLAETLSVCKRLFAYRKKQPWPPTIIKGDDWDTFYAKSLANVIEKSSLLSTADEAIAWANDLIAKINAAGENE